MRSLMLAVLVSGSVAWAQEPEGRGLLLTVGNKARVRTSASAEPLVGLVVAEDDETITLALAGNDGAPARVPRASISEAEMAVGRRGHALQGLAIGAIAGVGIGFAFPVDPVRCTSDSAYFCSRGQALLGGIVGDAGIGALIGHFVRTDRWSRATVAGSVAISRGGAGLRITLRF